MSEQRDGDGGTQINQRISWPIRLNSKQRRCEFLIFELWDEEINVRKIIAVEGTSYKFLQAFFSQLHKLRLQLGWSSLDLFQTYFVRRTQAYYWLLLPQVSNQLSRSPKRLVTSTSRSTKQAGFIVALPQIHARSSSGVKQTPGHLESALTSLNLCHFRTVRCLWGRLRKVMRVIIIARLLIQEDMSLQT